ncbi:FAD-linked sulfhydryl oxidase ERV1-like [Rutidosis leptorrhynchoides]|uniref:FAD-linked sulfhydryl oxidase ERV1-like n=1 Tax=Rutidosis leptorrhynchoides TaxID=125765 RepID=UPI003A995542
MSDNPMEAICSTFTRISASIQSNLSKLINIPQQPLNIKVSPSVSTTTPSSTTSSTLSADSFLSQPTDPSKKQISSGPVTKEELGRATWTFIHTLGAQYPEKPTRQQKKDVKELMAILSRIYPCKECADHFKEVLSSNPVQAGSQAEFSQWLCRVHNVVNRSLGKPTFPCERVDVRWGKLDCEHRVCDLQGSITLFGRPTTD